jgi:heme-degrading monooxygenase HmoA
MYMRIIWGRIVSGQWDGFEAAYKKATSLRGDVKGLKNQWLARDQADPDAGYSITLWESEADMRAFWDSKKREEAMALLRPFFLNQFTVTQCEVRSSQHE